MTRAWMQTISGRAVTMARPQPSEIDVLTDMPEMLARIARYNGAVPGGIYSVAQHCALMADVALDETGDADLAAAALLHDGHEYLLGDVTTPQVDGLDEIARDLFAPLFEDIGLPAGGLVSATIGEAKRRADAAIFKACGLPQPSESVRRAVKALDLRMLATEKRQLLAVPPRRWAAAVEQAAPVRLRGGLSIWSTARAADEFRRRLVELCPAVAGRASR